MTNNPKVEEIVIPSKIQVFEDKKIKARTVAFPFEFPDGTRGVLMASRLDQGKWVPAQDIQKLAIHFT